MGNTVSQFHGFKKQNFFALKNPRKSAVKTFLKLRILELEKLKTSLNVQSNLSGTSVLRE
jgi:hypothetical protein